MKVFDLFIYMLYTASMNDGDSNGRKSPEASARSYFCFLFASLSALLITTAIFRIEAYRKFLHHTLPYWGAYLTGMAQLVITGYIIFSTFKKYYTDARIQEVAATYNGILSKKTAIALYVILFLVHVFLMLYLLFPLLGLFANKKMALNL